MNVSRSHKRHRRRSRLREIQQAYFLLRFLLLTVPPLDCFLERPRASTMSDVSHENDTQCRVCLRCFVHPQACYQHRQATGHHVHQFPHKCDSCVRRFETETACFQHMDALGHWVWPSCCETCTARFKYDIHCENHMREHDHYHKPYHCPTCQPAWRTCNERDQHQASTGHYGHLHCADCDRYFQSAGNLDQHRKSRIHQGTTVRCPFCADAFVTASGLSHHIETSACPKAKNLDRQKVWQFLRERDSQGGFTERLLTYPGSKLSAEWNPASAWNGSCFQCYICGKEYQTPNML